MLTLVRRYARTHGPFPTAQIARRYGVDLTPALRELERSGELVRGELLPGGSEREWCDADVLRRVRRASVAALRQEVEAVDPAELARFLPAWQNVDAHRPGRRRPRPPARGAGAAAGRRADAGGLGARRAPAPARRLQPELARPADDRAASWSGSAPGRWDGPARWRSTSARTCGSAGPPPVEREARPPRGRAARRDPRAAGPSALVLARPGRRARLRARGDPRGALGPGLGRRGDQRRLRAAARPPADRGRGASGAGRAASPPAAGPRRRRSSAAGR